MFPRSEHYGGFLLMALEPGVARILDANANRAREGIRTAEDFARFALNDGRLASDLREQRHRLSAVVGRGIGAEALVCARDIDGDVGADRGGTDALPRGNFGEAALAGLKRAQEAVRVLEEAAKVSGRANWAELADVRYRLYGLERDLVLKSHPRAKLAPIRLYVLVTPELCARGVDETVEGAIRGGAEMVQFRQKTWEDGRYLQEAGRIGGICARMGAAFIVNDRVDVAAALGADGVHLGQGDLPVAAARRILGASAIIGRSTRGGEQARQAFEEGADYVAVGPMFATATAPDKEPVGPEGLRQTLALGLPAPVFAVGGISGRTAGAVLAAGGDRLAVCSAIVGKEDAEEAARELRSQLPK